MHPQQMSLHPPALTVSCQQAVRSAQPVSHTCLIPSSRTSYDLRSSVRAGKAESERQGGILRRELSQLARQAFRRPSSAARRCGADPHYAEISPAARIVARRRELNERFGLRR